jgi:hypothetical protein
MGRTRKPTAELKLQKTYRADRHGKNVDELLPKIIDTTTAVEPPKSITDDYVKQAFIAHTKMLCNLQLLAAADLPELEQLYLTLQQLREIETILLKTDPVKEIDNYERYTKMVIKLGNRFTTLAAKYYISPAARLRLTSDCLNIEKNKRDLENQSIASKLLAAKKV